MAPSLEREFSSHFLQLSPSTSAAAFIQPRRPSLEPSREILATRGQRLFNFLPAQQNDVDEFGFADGETTTSPAALRPALLRRGTKLIGKNTNPRYEWHRYYKSPEELKKMRKPIRRYYETNNELIAQFLYIDRLLDSSIPHNLIEEYDGSSHRGTDSNRGRDPALPDGSQASSTATTTTSSTRSSNEQSEESRQDRRQTKLKRTPQNLYRIPSETSPLLDPADAETGGHHPAEIDVARGQTYGASDRVVTVAIRVNFIANVLLLVAKIAVITLTSSLSVLASLVDGVLDFLSTAIIWTTTTLIRRQDPYRYPISRRRLEPISVLVFSVIMVTSFFQVALSCANRLMSDDHTLVELSITSIVLMASTVVVKLACWLWCRLIPNSSVQALAQDAMTDVVFNTFSIIFPLLGTFTKIWFLDPLGGLLLSLYVIWNWGRTAGEYIRRLTGAAASRTDHHILLYMTMRFSKVIQKIQDLKAYYAGDKLNVEVDIVLDEGTNLRDSHDVGESLQYMLESVPIVDRAFVHLDYDPWNLPSHMNQQE